MKGYSKVFQISIFSAIIVASLLYAFRPITVTRDNSVKMEATVTRITEGASQNVIFKFQDLEGVYYINRGLDKGIKLEVLKKELINKEVTVYYLKSGILSGLSPVSDTRHITELNLANKIIYSELD